MNPVSNDIPAPKKGATSVPKSRWLLLVQNSLPLNRLLPGQSFLVPFHLLGGQDQFGVLSSLLTWQQTARNGDGRTFVYRTHHLATHGENGWRVWRSDKKYHLPVIDVEIQVEDGYALPVGAPGPLRKRKKGSYSHHGRLQLDLLQPGQSVLIDDLTVGQVMGSVKVRRRVASHESYVCRTRRQEEHGETGVRVWRVE